MTWSSPTLLKLFSRGLNKSVKETSGWKDKYLNTKKSEIVQMVVPQEGSTTGKTINVTAYPLKGIDTIPETEDPVVYKKKIVDEAQLNLQGIIDGFISETEENKTFGLGGKYSVSTRLNARYRQSPAPSLLADQEQEALGAITDSTMLIEVFNELVIVQDSSNNKFEVYMNNLIKPSDG